MTQGELVTRLCKQRDEMTATIGEIREWVKEEPEGCGFCRCGEPILTEQGDLVAHIFERGDEYFLATLQGPEYLYRGSKIMFCPMCGRDLRET